MFETVKYNNYYVVNIKNRQATLENAEEFKQEVTRVIDEGNRYLVINFADVRYIDSTFMAALVSLLKYAMSKDGDIAVANLSEDIYDLFCLIRMEKVIKVYDEVPDSFSGSFGR